jgi:hypothetical protein
VSIKLTPKHCPCGCSNIILDPLCGCQCSSVQPAEAHEVMVKVNRFDELLMTLELLVHSVDDANFAAAEQVLKSVQRDLKAEPRFEKYHFTR